MSKLILSALAVMAFLSGCSSVTPAGMIAASRLDPLETAPGDLSFAVSVPEAFRLRDGDAEVTLSFSTGESTPEQSVAVNVPLSITAGHDGPRQAEPGETIYVLGLAPDAAARFLAVQKRVKALRAQGIQGKGSFSIGLSGGCLMQPLSDGFPFATWLRTAAGAGYIQMTRRADLFELMDADELKLFKKGLKPC